MLGLHQPSLSHTIGRVVSKNESKINGLMKKKNDFDYLQWRLSVDRENHNIVVLSVKPHSVVALCSNSHVQTTHRSLVSYGVCFVGSRCGVCCAVPPAAPQANYLIIIGFTIKQNLVELYIIQFVAPQWVQIILTLNTKIMFISMG